MSSRPIPVLVEDIWESTEKIERYIRGLDRGEFGRDDKTVDAVVRNLEIIGEAANRLPREFTAKHPDIEWRRLIGLRNRIVHDYFGIDLDIVWEILKSEVPTFKEKVSALKRDLAAPGGEITA